MNDRKKGLIRGWLFFVFFYNFLNQGNWKVIIIPHFLDEPHLFDVIFVIICDINSGFAGLSKQTFMDIKVNGFFGNAGTFNQGADPHLFLDKNYGWGRQIIRRCWGNDSQLI